MLSEIYYNEFEKHVERKGIIIFMLNQARGMHAKTRKGINMNITGTIDMHIHTGPDVRERQLDDIELAQAAIKLGVRAVVIKSHVMATAARATIAEKTCPGVRVFGGIVLNPHVGGINPLAVESTIEMGGKVVWLPTSYSVAQRSKLGKSDGVAVVVDNKVVPALSDIFKLIAEHNIVLATGHLSPAETFVVISEAQRCGVKKIVVTHPEIGTVSMSIADQKTLAENGVYFERVYAQPIGNGNYKSNLFTNLDAIEKVGYKSTIIATDSGQVENPVWNESIVEYISFLHAQGLSQNQLDIMTKKTPAKLLGLD